MSETVPLLPRNAHADDFRDAMAAVCAPVSVVTTIEGDHPYGTTVSAFASLSMEPPMVVISLDNRSELLSVVGRTGIFGLNVLSSGQADLALTFAQKGGPAKFEGVPWDERGGVPRLPNTCGFVACDVLETVTGGDHVVLFGVARVAESRPGQPLTYHRRTFGTHRAAE